MKFTDILAKTIAFIVTAITTMMILAVALVSAIVYFILVPFAHAMDLLTDGIGYPRKVR